MPGRAAWRTIRCNWCGAPFRVPTTASPHVAYCTLAHYLAGRGARPDASAPPSAEGGAQRAGVTD
jgi:hypothetical protein